MVEKLTKLYLELYEAGVALIDRPLTFSGGTKSAVLCLGNGESGIFLDSAQLTLAEETVCVAHEAGHIETGSTHALNSPYDLIERHEYRANK
jgi:hypothetical protein